LKIGLTIFHDGLEYREIVAIAQEAERTGLHSFWLIDHLHGSPQPDKFQLLETWTLISALATQTKNIRLGPLVLNINNRNPAILAKMATTLDQISGGRLEFGVGAGGMIRARVQKRLGYEYEFIAYNVDFPIRFRERIEKLNEGLEIIKKLWTCDVVTFQGKHYSVKNAICLPKSIQKPYPPIWIGGSAKSKILQIIAKYADGWNIMGASNIEDYRYGVKMLKEECQRIGRNIDEIKISVTVNGTLQECVNQLHNFSDEHIDLVILKFPPGKEIECLQNLNYQ